MNLDILITGGHVADPSQGISEIRNAGIIPDKIADIEGAADLTAKRVIDAKGCYVFPGLIDFHTHLNADGSSIADAGSCGCLTFLPAFHTDRESHWCLTVTVSACRG